MRFRRAPRELPTQPAVPARSISPDDVTRALPANLALPLESPASTWTQQVRSEQVAAAASVR